MSGTDCPYCAPDEPCARCLEQPNRSHVVRLRVTEQEREFLKGVAAAEDRSVSSVLRVALREYAERRDSSNGDRA